ncbi:hypothetical protein OPV22_029563 [Ensete ventricosum]|uniref:Protein kinase domain-containing protein n=1 Tax=Ensete ventricosum TaxID=4639 RepID=A0AAV8P684_ENSVE|nr:hypothetical protein OPV22_029563 [Ensete ventricosum]
MEFSPLSLLLILHFFLPLHVSSQTINTNTTLFSCSSNTSVSCSTFVLYRTQPEYTDLGSISDLFGVSRLSLEEANDLQSEEVTLPADQLLVVPVACGCTGNRSSANITYTIKDGDSFFLVSTQAFGNLTDYQLVEDLNPTLEPTSLKSGQEVIVPVYCKCPEKTQLDRGIKFLVTYVWSDEDDIFQLSKKMNSTADAMVATNNYRNFSAAVFHPILIPVPEKPHLPLLLYNTTSPAVDRSSKSNRKVIIVSTTVGAASAVVIWSLLLLVCTKFCQKTPVIGTRSAADLLTRNQSTRKVKKLLAGVSQFIDKPLMYEIKDIMESTMNLNEAHRIGDLVYQATLNGEMYAVKQAKGHVAEEMRISQIVNHANIIKLAGFSIHEDGRIFWVYEFAENGSLDKWLFAKPSSSDSIGHLSWRQRLDIALDVANALQYLHEHTRPSMVHRAIKTSNILLDAHFKAKISNFSMAKPATIGIRPSGDVFAFGVVLLELLSGKEEAIEDAEVGVLWREIRMVLEVEEERAGRLLRWMDPNLKGLYPLDGAMTLAAMARACTTEDSTERPRISEIVFSLSVLSQSCTDPFERASMMINSEERLPIKDIVVAR